MFWTILRFEAGFHLRRSVTWLYFAALFLFAFFLVASDALDGGASGLVRKNSPYSLAQYTLLVVAVGQVITTALVGTAALRDFQVGSHELVFTTRMSRRGYYFGRFFGAYAAMLVVYLGIPLGLMAGSVMPWVDAAKLLPVSPAFYFQPYLLFATTSLLFISALFFAVGALTRSIFAIYVQGIVLLVAWTVTQRWLGNLDRERLANLLDPFGLTPFRLATRYWTVAEKNTQMLWPAGDMLGNRLLWLGLACALLAGSFLLFRFEAHPSPLLPWRRRPRAARASAPPPARIPDVAPRFDRGLGWRQLWSTTRFSFLRIVRDVPFVAIAAIGCINAAMNAWIATGAYGSRTYPLTFQVAEIIAQSFGLYMLILTTVYAGESVWRERHMRADQIADTTPVSSAAVMAGKIAGVVGALVVLLAAFVGVGMGVQAAQGFFRFEPLLWVRFVFGATFPWMVATTLFAFAVHALVDNKFVGHLVIIAYWLGLTVLDALGWEHQLYQVGGPPLYTYSDMNGFGPFAANLVLSAGYALSVGLMLAVVGLLAWVRGTEPGRPARVAAAGARWRRPGPRFTLGAGALAAAAFGGAIFYNTNVLNEYRTQRGDEKVQAGWERSYKRFQHLAPPRIVDVDVAVDLRPERRAYSVDGRFVLVNKERAPIDSIFLSVGRTARLASARWSRAAAHAVRDTVTGSHLFVLRQPLAPGDTLRLRYALRYQARGFPNRRPNTRVVENGSFLDDVVPSLGYNPAGELSDDDARRRQKLPPRERMLDLDDPAARRNPLFRIDSDEIRFAATVSTAPDQIALAPGYLQREWTANGRRYARYVMDRPMTNFATIVSARYAVRRDVWRGPDGRPVEIAIYHHPSHTYNLDRMVAATRASLDYYTANFSPYQYRAVRILEFPRYASFAQSFPTTIPYSESAGFILRVDEKDERDLDLPFFVTAHEVAHQWWGHQVVGANAQGSALMVEAMSEYAALTVMERRYGPARTQKFLRYELNNYLQGRAGERRREQPLIRSEGQPYIHYYKGALVLYALRDYIGEAAMNRALRGYLARHAHESAPYSTARDFVGFLRAETPDSLKYLIEDMFEHITLYDNKANEASATRRPDGRWSVRVTVDARKVRADSLGNETPRPLADYVEVGVFGAREPGNALGRPLAVRRVRITQPRTTVELVVDGEPRRAGIDPFNKLIDRVPADNVRDVARSEAPGRVAVR